MTVRLPVSVAGFRLGTIPMPSDEWIEGAHRAGAKYTHTVLADVTVALEWRYQRPVSVMVSTLPEAESLPGFERIERA